MDKHFPVWQTQKKRARDVKASGRSTPTGGTSVEAPPTLQPITGRPNFDAVKRMRIEMGTTPVEFAVEHLEDARPELIEAMKCLDSSEHRDLHYRLGNFVNDFDDLRALLAERYGSS